MPQKRTIPRTCQQCGAAFMANAQQVKLGKAHFCSRDCRGASARKRVTCTCEQCGKTYEMTAVHASKAKYCSRDCQAVAKRRLLTLTCEQCGEPFTARPSAIKGHKVCSVACRDALRTKRVTCVCVQCGKEYAVHRFRAERARFCSQSCRAVFINTRIALQCEECGKEYRVKRYRVREGSRFCSRACALRHQGETSIEAAIRHALDALDIAYLPQHPIGRYSADFFLPQIGVLIETDGTYWHSLNPARDARRDAWMRRRGYRTIRIPERDITTGEPLAIVRAHLAPYRAVLDATPLAQLPLL
jgi:very-short-patch-repair endonuclease